MSVDNTDLMRKMAVVVALAKYSLELRDYGPALRERIEPGFLDRLREALAEYDAAMADALAKPGPEVHP